MVVVKRGRKIVRKWGPRCVPIPRSYPQKTSQGDWDNITGQLCPCDRLRRFLVNNNKTIRQAAGEGEGEGEV